MVKKMRSPSLVRIPSRPRFGKLWLVFGSVVFVVAGALIFVANSGAVVQRVDVVNNSDSILVDSTRICSISVSTVLVCSNQLLLSSNRTRSNFALASVFTAEGTAQVSLNNFLSSDFTLLQLSGTVSVLVIVTANNAPRSSVEVGSGSSSSSLVVSNGVVGNIIVTGRGGAAEIDVSSVSLQMIELNGTFLRSAIVTVTNCSFASGTLPAILLRNGTFANVTLSIAESVVFSTSVFGLFGAALSGCQLTASDLEGNVIGSVIDVRNVSGSWNQTTIVVNRSTLGATNGFMSMTLLNGTVSSLECNIYNSTVSGVNGSAVTITGGSRLVSFSFGFFATVVRAYPGLNGLTFTSIGGGVALLSSELRIDGGMLTGFWYLFWSAALLSPAQLVINTACAAWGDNGRAIPKPALGKSALLYRSSAFSGYLNASCSQKGTETFSISVARSGTQQQNGSGSAQLSLSESNNRSKTESLDVLSGSVTATSSLSSTACDIPPWGVRLLDPSSGSSWQVTREVAVSYEWFDAVNHTAMLLEVSSLSPWRIVGAHLVVGGERLTLEVIDADLHTGGNVTLRLSPSLNFSGISSASNSHIWPGVMRAPYLNQLIDIALVLSCRAFSFAPAFSLLVKGLPFPSISPAAVSVMENAQGVSALSGSPASGATMARLSSATSLSACMQAIDISAVSQSADKVRALVPIDFYNATTSNDDIVNSLLANVVLVASFAAVVLLTGVLVARLTATTLRDVLLHLRWPSTMYPAFVATLPSVVGSVAAFVIRAASPPTIESADWAPCLFTCGIGVVVWLGFCAWMTAVCVRGSSLLVPLRTDIPSIVGEVKRCSIAGAFHATFASKFEWASRTAQSPSSIMRDDENDSDGDFLTFIQSNSSAFSELRVAWFTAFDVWATFLSAVIGAIPLQSEAGCISVAVSNVIMSLVLCLVAVVIRPYGSLFGTAHLMLTQMGSLACTCCVLAYIVTGNETLLGSLSLIVIVIGALSMFRTIVDLVALVQAAIRLRSVLITHRSNSKHSDKESADFPAQHSPATAFNTGLSELEAFLLMEDSCGKLDSLFADEDFAQEPDDSRFWDPSGRIAADVLDDGLAPGSLLLDYAAGCSGTVDLDFRDLLHCSPSRHASDSLSSTLE